MYREIYGENELRVALKYLSQNIFKISFGRGKLLVYPLSRLCTNVI